MASPYVLIDFENVQPKELGRLVPGSFRIKVFLGQNQTRLMLDIVQALQPFGHEAEYIQIQGSGPDAVDFHIAFYIGQIAASEPGATFTIVSKDKGFDPLVRHLEQRGIGCKRVLELPESIASTPQISGPAAIAEVKPKAAQAPAKPKSAPVIPKAKSTPSPSDAKAIAKQAQLLATTKNRVKTVVEYLKKSTKPAKLATLRTSIKSWFKPAIDDNAVDAILQSLTDSKKLAVAGTKVTYSLG